MEINCSNCGQNYEVTPEHAGMEFECSNCQTNITVPVELFVVPDSTPPEQEEASPLRLKRDTPEKQQEENEPGLEQNAMESTPTEEFGDHGKCPKCHANLKPNAKICIECGHNLQLGMNVQTVAKAKKAGSFGLAIGIAAVTAVVCALIWAGIAILTGFEIGWVAWGVGVAVGVSVVIMTDERSVRLGLWAVVLVFGAILLGKIIYFNWGVAKSAAKELSRNQEVMISFTIWEMKDNNELDEKYSQWIEKNGLSNPEAEMNASKEMQELIQKERQKAQDKLAKMSPEEKKKLSLEGTKKIIAIMPTSEKLAATCSFWDILWFLLAISSAWKIATGQNETT